MDTSATLQKMGVPNAHEIAQYHSACCRGNWELVYGNSKFELECALCGRSIGPAFRVIGPDLEKGKCAKCGQPVSETPLEQWLREKAPCGTFAPVDRGIEQEFIARARAATTAKEKEKINEEINQYIQSIIQTDVKMVEDEKTIYEGALLFCTRDENTVSLHFPNCTIWCPREDFDEVKSDFRGIANTYEKPEKENQDAVSSEERESKTKDIYQGERVDCWGDEKFVTLAFPHITIDFDREDWNQIKDELLAIGNTYEPSFIYKDGASFTRQVKQIARFRVE